MAMIKCPECGHEISDQAPYCPSCGVAIKDKLTKCPACGKVYFKDQPACPKCGHPTNGQTENAGINTPATVTENT
ncbi:zinc ribbon domain-containing protein, partial [Prevotella sp.]